MSPEAQRIAILEVLGWRGCTDSKCSWRKAQHLHKDGIVAFPESFSVPRYPDPLNNLNACAKMRNVLTTKDQQNRFIEELIMVAIAPAEAEYGFTCSQQDRLWIFLNSTPEQQCEAFLKTLNLWVP